MNIYNLAEEYTNNIKDDTATGYHLVFKLIDNKDISLITTIDEFNEILEWYKDNDKLVYTTGCTCSSCGSNSILYSFLYIFNIKGNSFN